MSNMFKNINKASMSIENSSVISKIEWKTIIPGDSPIGDVIITFTKTKEKYKYIDVPYSVLQEMLSAESIGKFFLKNIKCNFKHNKCIL